MTELKPCPFCGGAAKIMYGDNNLRQEQDLHVAFVCCKKCKAKTNVSHWFGKDSGIENVNYVIKLWNRRVENGN